MALERIACKNGVSPLTDRLYQGGRPGLWMPGMSPSVASVEVHTVVLCAEEYQPAQELMGRVEVLRCPFDDDFQTPPSHEQLDAIAETAMQVARRLDRGLRVMTSCNMGWNRSGLVSALALCITTRQPGDVIIRHIRRCRHRHALGNPIFQQAVVDFAKRLRRR